MVSEVDSVDLVVLAVRVVVLLAVVVQAVVVVFLSSRKAVLVVLAQQAQDPGLVEVDLPEDLEGASEVEYCQ